MIQAHAAATPHADPYMEPVFSRRIRCLFDALLSGAWSFLSVLIIPRTSEPEHKLYLYLSEVIRQGSGGAVPPPYLYNLLQTRSKRSRAYGQQETARLLAHLAGVTGRSAGKKQLLSAVSESNAARGAIRRVLGLRRGKKPRLRGTEALAAIGSWYFMDRAEYTRTALDFASDVSRRPPLEGPRILIQGASLDHPALHAVIESQGAVVTAEDDWWGSRSAGRDIRAGSDPVAAIFDKYYLDAPSPRSFPAGATDRWFQAAALSDIEGVVFYLPPEDDLLGWDYPRQMHFLDEHRIPSLLVREDARCLSAGTRQQIGEFIARLPRARGGR
jgi:benzoyl-CoA reductase/2-hydroxyglutaryl-CoA dehydratase subunit BcrC/BadD/HgdB